MDLEELMDLLEDLEDAEEMDRLRASDDERIPWEQAKAELRSRGVLPPTSATPPS